MNFRKYIFVMFALVLTFSLFAEERVVIRFEKPTLEIVNEFSQYDVAAYKPGEFLDLVVTKLKYEELLTAGYQIQITQTEEQMSNNLNEVTELAGYRDYDEMLAELQQIEIDYPDICKLYDIGDSHGKNYSENGNSNYDNYAHDIWLLKVSDNVEIEEDEPSVYYLAEHHAREPISLEVTMEILYHILENYGTNPQITENVDNTQIWFIPLVNPDGHKIVTEEIELMWRKNICDNNENGSIDVSGYYAQDGTDPNRNYGWNWGGASTSWTSETYQGTSAFSEPETQATKSLIDSHHFVAGISYHSYSELVLFPFGYAYGVVAPDFYALQELAIDMAETIEGQNGGNYIPQSAWELYPCTGTTDDYSYGTHGIFSFTVELATEFIPPAGAVNGICENNIEAAMILLNRVHHSTLTGHITNADTGEIIEAQIFVDGVDNTGVFREPYMSDDEFGRYYRLLTNGTYSVTFSAFGFDSQTIENIVISDDDVTVVDVEMVPSANTFDVTGFVLDGETGDPIANATVDITDFNIEPITTDQDGAYTIAGLYEYDYTVAVYKEDYAGKYLTIEASAVNNEFDFELYVLDDGTFESGVFGNCWEMAGNNDWVIDNVNFYAGNNSARSGSIGHSQTTSMAVSLYMHNEGEISFFKKVSSEENYDYLRFYVDDALIDMWSGNDDWDEQVYSIEAGFHTFRWEYYKDQGVANGQDYGWIDNIQFPVNTVEIQPDGINLPLNAQFYGNYPNPFNPSTTFKYSLGSSSDVVLEIYNIKGQKVKTLVNERQDAGYHQIIWDGNDENAKQVSSGIYFTIFKDDSDYTSLKKIILLK